ncbi:uncharacterized protein LOC132639653 [Lycium barbarum]|uniref:uncharacterized protein LOC132639653 n=1 Tax=Lycium barbarum TaxID=112863 RepID=UPI00293F1541|nr:uncharacterized protein LOC132639653 [Lycium barbarum]
MEHHLVLPRSQTRIRGLPTPMIITTWNVRGLKQPLKQKELKLFLHKHKIDVIGCLETKIKEHKAQGILTKVAMGWNHCCNYPMAYNGRIWLLWKSSIQLQVLSITEQLIHCKVEDNNNFNAFLIVIYAKNDAQQRQTLWADLIQLDNSVQGAWLLSGDFNTLLSSGDRLGFMVLPAETQEFRDCIDTLQLTPLNSKGWHFTFCNKQQAGDRVYSKIDWAFGNLQWLNSYSQVEADFLNPGMSDHTPILIQYLPQTHTHPKPFKLFSTVMEHPDFTNILDTVWGKNIVGTKMFKLWMKSKMLKEGLKGLNHYLASYSQKLQQARQNREIIQAALHTQPLNQHLIDQEKETLLEIAKWKVTDEEILAAIKGMPPAKSLDIDGYPIEFFTRNWEVVKVDVLSAVKEFFKTGKLLKAFSGTSVTLIPKIPNPSLVKDYRPIDCCTTFYKMITKVLTNRIKTVIVTIIGPSQSAFMEGRSITDNIIFSHELFKWYNRKRLSPRCVMKLDLRKAYDAIECCFLKIMMAELGFPYKFIIWIIECISSISYSLVLNEGLEKPVPRKRGIKQGDPMSPYLFVIVMEYLQRELDLLVTNKPFKFHPR